MDNRDVLPCSPYLSKRFDAHINVEMVSNTRLVKYIYKYAFKGYDRAHVEVQAQIDEVQTHINARYIGASEAVWHLF